ncbi:hypothetical protein ACRALDRAFT_212838 [Sodiomyces alcalophilus JCM 7366]|uniref:uncharacterized protein n=1 Tax=Sodiomyces alcalophilus JCM 7366 TaxID=591952 RepID=UPI0039B50C07
MLCDTAPVVRATGFGRANARSLKEAEARSRAMREVGAQDGMHQASFCSQSAEKIIWTVATRWFVAVPFGVIRDFGETPIQSPVSIISTSATWLPIPRALTCGPGRCNHCNHCIQCIHHTAAPH